MSQYLSRFYCGNNKGLCNFQEPIKYEKLIGRTFDQTTFDLAENCDGKFQQKGYCCPNKEEYRKPMDEQSMEEINNIAGFDFFEKDNDIFKRGQVPLVKVDYDDNLIKSINVCQCGGEEKEYDECVKKNCKDYKVPTKYEYCKMGDKSSLLGCYGKNQEECKVGTSNPHDMYVYSKNLKINDLYPDCYLNMCNKSQVNGNIDYLMSNTYNSEENQEVHDIKSIKYTLLNKETKDKNDIGFSIEKMLIN